jgi:hypothetical protein
MYMVMLFKLLEVMTPGCCPAVLDCYDFQPSPAGCCFVPEPCPRRLRHYNWVSEVYFVFGPMVLSRYQCSLGNFLRVTVAGSCTLGVDLRNLVHLNRLADYLKTELGR